MSYYNHEHSGHYYQNNSCCSQCKLGQIEDFNLIRLKSTNNELKELIRKIDDMTDCIVETKKNKCFCHQPPITTNYFGSRSSNSSRESLYECDSYRNNRSRSIENNKHEYILCQDCDHMLQVNKQIKPIPKRDHNIYPVEYYPHGNQRNCSRCQQCKRERSHSRNSARSTSSMRSSRSTEIKPVWNGGPFKQSYLWRDDKLKDQ